VLLAGALLAAAVVSADYEALIRQYAAGEREAAVAALSRWRPGDLDRQVRALQRSSPGTACPSCPDRIGSLPLKAAVMLHADRDALERPRSAATEQSRPCSGAQARRAGQIAAILAGRTDTRDFARRFFMAMAHRSQWDFCLDAAQEWARDGLALFPADPHLLLALGATLEEKATLAALPPSTPTLLSGFRRTRGVADPTGDRTRWFGEAERVLSAAVAADPEMVEARIRLGRVQWRLAKDELARPTLEEAVRRGGPPPLPHLAHLFLGQALERAGRAREAAGQFEEALRLEPESQCAAVALSHALLAAGDALDARRILEETLTHAGRRAERDPYWDYPASNAASAERTLLALRRETRE
jgi:tetratricopeptide (TPR) repeat protein